VRVQLAVEAEHERLHGPALAVAAVAEVALAQVDAVLGEEEGHSVELLGGERGQGRKTAADGVRDAVLGDADTEWAKCVLQQVRCGERVVNRGAGGGRC